AVREDARRLTVDEDERGAALLLGTQVALALLDGGQDEPVDAALEERVDGSALAAWVVVEARGDDRCAVRPRRIFDGAMHGARKWVRHVSKQQAERTRAVVGATQVPGMDVRPVVERANRFEHL